MSNALERLKHDYKRRCVDAEYTYAMVVGADLAKLLAVVEATKHRHDIIAASPELSVDECDRALSAAHAEEVKALAALTAEEER